MSLKKENDRFWKNDKCCVEFGKQIAKGAIQKFRKLLRQVNAWRNKEKVLNCYVISDPLYGRLDNLTHEENT